MQVTSGKCYSLPLSCISKFSARNIRLFRIVKIRFSAFRTNLCIGPQRAGCPRADIMARRFGGASGQDERIDPEGAVFIVSGTIDEGLRQVINVLAHVAAKLPPVHIAFVEVDAAIKT